jgi:cell division protease FtsH
MVTEYGMSDKLGPQTYGHKDEMPFLGKEMTEHRNYSEEIAALIDQEVSNFIKKGRVEAEQLIQKHKKEIEKIADKLLKEETISAEEFVKLLAPAPKKKSVKA